MVDIRDAVPAQVVLAVYPARVQARMPAGYYYMDGIPPLNGLRVPPRQRAGLFRLVSMATGRPIDRTSPEDPDGFGLGVQQSTWPKVGTVWTYLGGTLGFRTRHVYLPDSGVIFAFGVNSQATDGHHGELITVIYDRLLTHGVIDR